MFSCLDKAKNQETGQGQGARSIPCEQTGEQAAEHISASTYAPTVSPNRASTCSAVRRKTFIAGIVVSLSLAILAACVSSFRLVESTAGYTSLLYTGLLGTPTEEKTTSMSAIAGGAKPHSDAVEARTSVAAIGRLEPLSRVSRVSVPAFLKDERILKLVVSEGDWLEAGQVICIMDAEPRLFKELQQAQEAVTLAKTQLNKVLAGAKLGEIGAAKASFDSLRRERSNRIKNQEAVIAKASAELAFSRHEFERYKQLVAEGAVSHSQYDAKLTTMKTNQAVLAEALSEKQRIQETLDSRIEEAEANLNRVSEVRPVDVAVAKAELKQAEARRDRVALDLSLCKVVSPRSGRVLKINARPGETIGSNGIIDLGNTQQMVAVAEVYQSDLPRLRVGQPAIIEGDGMTGPARGKVLNIGWEVARQSVFSQEPSSGSDARVVEVKIEVAPKDNFRVEKLTNMQVECRFIDHDSSKR
jgi:HlyD family secretion protein